MWEKSRKRKEDLKEYGMWERFPSFSFFYITLYTLDTHSLGCQGRIRGVCEGSDWIWCWCDIQKCKEWETVNEIKTEVEMEEPVWMTDVVLGEFGGMITLKENGEITLIFCFLSFSLFPFHWTFPRTILHSFFVQSRTYVILQCLNSPLFQGVHTQFLSTLFEISERKNLKREEGSVWKEWNLMWLLVFSIQYSWFHRGYILVGIWKLKLKIS